jgi:hypothetical protein
MQDSSAKRERYLRRAEEIRAIATGIYDPKEREVLMRVAADYEFLGRGKQRR